MDASLWENLPDDVLERILSRLPVRSFCRIRAVCKHWNSLVHRRSFLDLCSEAPSARPWIIVFTGYTNMEPVYDFWSKKWYRIKLPKPELQQKALMFDIRALISDAGLICYHSGIEKVISVVNLLSKSSRIVAYPESRRLFLLGIVTDRSKNTYRIIATAWLWNGDKIMIVYKSEKDSWTRIRSEVQNQSCEVDSSGVHVNRKLYMVCSGYLVCYDMDAEVWRKTEVTGFPGTGVISYRTSVLGWQNRLFIIGAETCVDRMRVANRNFASSICIWEFRIDRHDWVLFDRMPRDFFQNFFSKNVTDISSRDRGVITQIDFTGYGNVVMMWYFEIKRISEVAHRKYALYDFETRVWSVVQGFETQDHGDFVADSKDARNFATGPPCLFIDGLLVYEPRLSALP